MLGFGESKERLIENLVECWNELAIERGQPVTFRRLQKGFEWIVVLEVLTFKDTVEIQVFLCESEAQAEKLLNASVKNPQGMGFDSVHRTVGPYGRLYGENLGMKGHEKWLESLNEHGQLRSPHWPPPNEFSDYPYD